MRNDSRATLPVQGNRYPDEHIRLVGLGDKCLAKHWRGPPRVPDFVPEWTKNGAPDKIQTCGLCPRSRNESLPSS
jgi:hypothetical protein